MDRPLLPFVAGMTSFDAKMVPSAFVRSCSVTISRIVKMAAMKTQLLVKTGVSHILKEERACSLATTAVVFGWRTPAVLGTRACARMART